MLINTNNCYLQAKYVFYYNKAVYMKYRMKSNEKFIKI